MNTAGQVRKPVCKYLFEIDRPGIEAGSVYCMLEIK